MAPLLYLPTVVTDCLHVAEVEGGAGEDGGAEGGGGAERVRGGGTLTLLLRSPRLFMMPMLFRPSPNFSPGGRVRLVRRSVGGSKCLGLILEKSV